MQHRFGYQKLEVFQAAKAAVAVGVRHRDCFRRLPGELAPQLERALLSVVNNIVEGAGRVSAADQRRHYQIARGSATEAAGCVEIACLYGTVPAAVEDELSGLLFRVVQMLSRMCVKRE